MLKVPVTLTDDQGCPVVFTGPCTVREVRLNCVPARSITYVHPGAGLSISVKQSFSEVRRAFAKAMTAAGCGDVEEHPVFNLHKDP